VQANWNLTFILLRFCSPKGNNFHKVGNLSGDNFDGTALNEKCSFTENKTTLFMLFNGDFLRFSIESLSADEMRFSRYER
jgi:hypothetical protein